VKTIADRYMLAYVLLIITSTSDGLLDLLRSMTLNDLELPKRVFSEFFAIFG